MAAVRQFGRCAVESKLDSNAEFMIRSVRFSCVKVPRNVNASKLMGKRHNRVEPRAIKRGPEPHVLL
jgi:hypothetical protein